MLKTLLSAMCLALVFFLVFTFDADDVAQARQNPEHKGSWVGFDFGDDDDFGGGGYDNGDDEGDDSGDDDDDDGAGDDDEED